MPNNTIYPCCSDGRVSENTTLLIRQLLVLDPKARLTASQVLDSLRVIIVTWYVSHGHLSFWTPFCWKLFLRHAVGAMNVCMHSHISMQVKYCYVFLQLNNSISEFSKSRHDLDCASS